MENNNNIKHKSEGCNCGVWPSSPPPFFVVTSLIFLWYLNVYLCVKGAPLLRSARNERVNWQREEGPSPQQPEVTAPLGGGHGCGLVGGQSARAPLPGVTRLWRLHGSRIKPRPKFLPENYRSFQQISRVLEKKSQVWTTTMSLKESLHGC